MIVFMLVTKVTVLYYLLLTVQQNCKYYNNKTLYYIIMYDKKKNTCIEYFHYKQVIQIIMIEVTIKLHYYIRLESEIKIILF